MRGRRGAPGVLRVPWGRWEIRGSAPVCPGAVPALSCGVWVSPSPGQCAVTRDPDSSEFASVIYGFVLLLGTPALVCVLPTPGRVRGPAPAPSSWPETPGRWALPGGPHPLPAARALLGALAGCRRAALLPASGAGEGGEAAGAVLPGELRPGWPAEGPQSPCPSFLSSRILFPQKRSWRIVTRAPPVCAGGRRLCSTRVFGPREGRRRGPGRQAPRGTPPSEGAVRPCSAAVPPFLTSGLGGTRTLGSLYSRSCAIREAAAPGRPAPPPPGYTHVAQTIFQIKTLLTMQVGSCIPLQVSLALPCCV